MKANDHLLMAYAHVQQLRPIGVLINLWGPTGPKIGMHLHHMQGWYYNVTTKHCYAYVYDYQASLCFTVLPITVAVS